MNNDLLHDRLRDAAWRRDLTPGEAAQLQAWLAEHPGAATDWDAEVALTQTLNRLPDAPVPSNFTARVLQRAAHRPVRHTRESGHWASIWHRFLPRVAIAMVAVVAGVLTYGEYQATQRTRMARSVATISHVAAGPSAEVVVRDFDTIRRLGEARVEGGDLPDTDLLALMR